MESDDLREEDDGLGLEPEVDDEEIVGAKKKDLIDEETDSLDDLEEEELEEDEELDDYEDHDVI